jgi:oligopeptide transport system permease protein
MTTAVIDETEASRRERLWEESRRVQGVSLGQDAWRRFRRDRVSMLSLVFLLGMGILALATPLLPLQSPRLVNVDQKFQPMKFRPLFASTVVWLDESSKINEAKLDECFGELNFVNDSLIKLRAAIFGRWEATSWLGTDHLGRDQLARLFWGARVSLLVGVVAGLVSLVIGVSYGATSGYIGGWVDAAMMRVIDVMYSVPFIFIVIFLITVLSEESIKKWLLEHGIDRIVIFYVVVGAIYWLTMARVVRGQVLSLKQQQFIEAARTVGCSRARIIFVHLVPNLLSIIIVYLTLTIPRVMLFESFLSFLGLGVEPPDVSWGLLANEGAKNITPIGIVWWLIVGPGIALGLTCAALNRLGDGLRDALDPRLKNR